MQDLSLHILDITENSIAAGADKISIKIIEDTRKNQLTIEISDNGKGMDEDTIKKVYDPFFTTKTVRRVGLGVPLLAQAARESNGSISIASKKGKGTAITVNFQYNHIDRKPLGDMEKTMMVLVAGNPEVDFIYEHKRNDLIYRMDTVEIRETLRDVPINDPGVIKFIKDDISEWLKATKHIIIKNDNA